MLSPLSYAAKKENEKGVTDFEIMILEKTYIPPIHSTLLHKCWLCLTALHDFMGYVRTVPLIVHLECCRLKNDPCNPTRNANVPPNKTSGTNVTTDSSIPKSQFSPSLFSGQVNLTTTGEPSWQMESRRLHFPIWCALRHWLRQDGADSSCRRLRRPLLQHRHGTLSSAVLTMSNSPKGKCVILGRVVRSMYPITLV